MVRPSSLVLLLGLLGLATAFVRPGRGVRNPWLLPATAEETAEALELYKSRIPESQRLSDAEVKSRFQLLEDKSGSATAAMQIMSNSIIVMKFSPDLVSSSYDAWVERFGSQEEATETLIKNPNLLACDPVGVTTAPVLTTKVIANIMDLFR